MPKLDAWLPQVFDPANLDATCEAMGDAQRDDESTTRSEAARQKIADCDRRLANYRKTIDAGGPSATIASWMAEVEAERLAAERELGRTVSKEPLTPSQIKAMVTSLKDNMRLLTQADPATKAVL
jgi:site-specific DNA recombinase